MRRSIRRKHSDEVKGVYSRGEKRLSGSPGI